MNINFIFTNYNNSLLSIQAIKSIWEIEGIVNPHIVIIDNFSEYRERAKLKNFQKKNSYKNLHFLYLDENIGYFKGLNQGIRMMLDTGIKFDYFIIGNNDLIFPKNLYQKILKNKINHGPYPVISPNLVTRDGVHQNPHVLNKISKLRKIIYALYFLNYQVAKFILMISTFTSSISKRKDSLDYKRSGVINMGYGACYLLTKKFFEYYNELDAITFLMGEEAFLSNQIHTKGLEIYYDSEIEILHYDQASCGQLPAKRMWNYTKESYKLYRKLI